MIRLTARAHAALRDGEVIVVDWASLGLGCGCGCAGEAWLQTAPRAVALRRRGFRAVDASPAGMVIAHPLARALLAGRDVVVDCQRRFGFRRLRWDLPRDAGLAESLRATGAGSFRAAAAESSRAAAAGPHREERG